MEAARGRRKLYGSGGQDYFGRPARAGPDEPDCETSSS